MARKLPISAALLLFLTSIISCSHGILDAPPTPQYIPTKYYTSLEVSPDALLLEYFHINFGNVIVADQNYKNLPILFKNIQMNEVMLRDKGDDILYISSIKCTPLRGGDISALKVGDMIDIIGINRGPWLEYNGWLHFTDCLFLPSGLFQVSQGVTEFTPGY